MNKRIPEIELDVYDPVEGKPGYVRYREGRPIEDIVKELVDALKDHDLYDNFDYLHIDREMKGKKFPERWAVACYVLRGGSEGHYIHLDVITKGEGNRIPILTGKTLLRMDEALELSGFITKAIYGY